MGNWDRVSVNSFLTLKMLCQENKIVKEEWKALEFFFK